MLTGDFGRRFRCLALDLPGHGQSEPARDEADYSLPGHAAALTGFAGERGATDAVFVGWSMGGRIVLEAAPALPDARGFVIFGAPPVASPAEMAEAFLPNPAAGVLFQAQVSESEAQLAAASFTAPGSPLDLGEFVSDILATDGAARTGWGPARGRAGSPMSSRSSRRSVRRWPSCRAPTNSWSAWTTWASWTFPHCGAMRFR
jgi:pimeloyl-ACP methyl ester carboxylesterase